MLANRNRCFECGSLGRLVYQHRVPPCGSPRKKNSARFVTCPAAGTKSVRWMAATVAVQTAHRNAQAWRAIP